MKYLKLLFPALLLSAIFNTNAQVIESRSCSQSDVQDAIDLANDGDTIVIPSGNCMWNTHTPGQPTVSIIDKQITLMGQGINNTVITDATGANYNEPALSIRGTEGAPFRISGIHFVGTTTISNNTDIVHISGDCKNWRIDNCRFEHPGRPIVAIHVTGNTYGLIDHSEFENVEIEVFNDREASWESPLSLGSENAVYVEDCEFNNVYGELDDLIDGRDGARYVVRYCTIKNLHFHAHGLDACNGCRGTHSYEFYENTLICEDGVNCYRWAYIRGGTGVIFNNTLEGNWGEGIVLASLCSDPARCWGEVCDTYPCKDQVGRSSDNNNDGIQDQEPLYEWNNTEDGENTDMVVSNPDHTFILQENRDYYNDTRRPNYTPYIYPHPLNSGSVIPPLAVDNPADFKIIRITPNPVNTETRISYSIQETGTYKFEIYNIYGQLVKHLFEGELTAENHEIIWDAANAGGSTVPNGGYFIRISTDKSFVIGKIVVLK